MLLDGSLVLHVKRGALAGSPDAFPAIEAEFRQREPCHRAVVDVDRVNGPVAVTADGVDFGLVVLTGMAAAWEAADDP